MQKKESFVERDIIKNSYYVIYYFNENNTEVTNLKLQKLLYFLEALYMHVTKENFLFDDDFEAWDFGPVCKRVYDEFKMFEREPIKLTPEEQGIAQNMPAINKLFISTLHRIFKNYTTYDLVSLTHEEDSPWSKVYEQDSNEKLIISKIETKDWFSRKIESK